MQTISCQVGPLKVPLSDGNNESATDSSPETDIETSSETDTTSLSLGAAGVVLSGNGFEFDTAADNFTENDSDTGGATDNEADTDSEDLGGNTTSDSLSTSETDTDSGSGNLGGSDQSSSTLNIAYGAGPIITGGAQTEGASDNESSTETASDTTSDSDQDSETDSDIEAADGSSDTLSHSRPGDRLCFLFLGLTRFPRTSSLSRCHDDCESSLRGPSTM